MPIPPDLMLPSTRYFWERIRPSTEAGVCFKANEIAPHFEQDRASWDSRLWQSGQVFITLIGVLERSALFQCALATQKERKALYQYFGDEWILCDILVSQRKPHQQTCVFRRHNHEGERGIKRIEVTKRKEKQ